MGRLKKYETLEERKEARKKASHIFYWKNKEKCDEKSKEYYKRKKESRD